MKTFLGMITLLLGCCPLALAFDNLEADAAYNGAIKQEIMSEFSQGTKMLKAYADRLGKTIKDINVLQQRMYNKAVLMGRCVDKAATIRKKDSSKTSLEKYTLECIEEHLKCVAKEPAIPARCSYMKFWEPPYDFLAFDSMCKRPANRACHFIANHENVRPLTGKLRGADDSGYGAARS